MRIFLSYKRDDQRIVAPVAAALKAKGHLVFWDQDLNAGEAWAQRLGNWLDESEALVVFLSPASAGSPWVVREVAHFSRQTQKPLLPVMISRTSPAEVPIELRAFQWLDVASFARDAENVAERIIGALARLAPASGPASAVGAKRSVRQIAAGISSEINSGEARKASGRSIFVVHGHDESMKDEVVAYLRSVSVNPIVLKDIRGARTSLFEKFRDVAGEARFAVVLFSADDFGASAIQFNEVADRALKYRARQNVVLELGFFFGKLG